MCFLSSCAVAGRDWKSIESLETAGVGKALFHGFPQNYQNLCFIGQLPGGRMASSRKPHISMGCPVLRWEANDGETN